MFVCSLHADPDEEYPYYCGFAHEIGCAAGEGYTLNLPLPIDAGETAYLAALDVGLTAVDQFGPDVLVVSVGFDTLAGDPQGEMQLRPASFRAIGRALAGLGRPLLLVQEGGYLVPMLGDALRELLDGLTGQT